MKKIILLLLAFVVFSACKDDDDSNGKSDLLGTYRLVEILADSGGGNGEFTAVESDKTITFKANNVITSNGTLCGLELISGTTTSGTYNQTARTYVTDECGEEGYKYSFEVDGDNVIIYYPCIEGCAAKFKKIN